MRGYRSGFTLLEVLVTLTIMAVLMALGIGMLRPPHARLYANDVRALVQQGRFEAIKRNEAVAVVWDSSAKTFKTMAGGNGSCSATGTTLLSSKPTSDYRNLSVTTNMSSSGLVWWPSGQARNCGNAGFSASTTTITDGRTTLYIKVSSGGRVRITNVN